MLEIKNITKIYKTLDLEQKALDNVSIQFRENEFVSILGQSGSGKTTLLNIIGGLDHYTTGDLIINGISTKKYKDRDWDTYRNHSIGFVFQSYNLIPHQTALSNVELALTLSGVSKDERRKRAVEVLRKVGLESHMNKKPNQMSGGQMQRIAIARALINDPDILLADEPTGALDSETSIQIMELLKEIAKEKLVIMVTHNPEIANKYSTRIVKLLDGKIIDDSNPVIEELSVDNNKKEETKKKSNKKTSMSFMTALSLSLNNLMTKKGRTILTAFAGSIGIIGIALILSLSSGVQNYINRVEEDTLSSYPLTIEEQTVDTANMITSLMTYNEIEEDRDPNKIYSGNIMAELINSMASQIETNNLEEFKKYLEDDKNNFKEYTTAIKYSYNLELQLYKSDTSEGIVRVNPTTILNSFGIDGMDSMFGMSEDFGGSSMGPSTNVFLELLDNKELLKEQYDVLAGTWPKAYNEVVLMVDKNNQVSDYALYALGLKDQKELKDTYKNILEGKEMESEVVSYSYDEFLDLTFKLVLNTDYFEKQGDFWIDKSNDENYLKKIIDDAEEIKIVGIIRPNEESAITSTTGAVGYTSELTKYVIDKIQEATITKEQIENPEINVFTGIKFQNQDEKFDMSSLTPEQQAYLATLSKEELASLIAQYTENAGASYTDNLKTLGIMDINKPSTINIYPKDFESKEKIVALIDAYNSIAKNNNQEELVINYTDIVGVMMSSVSTIIDTISYVLIAFVAISLVVSSIMIGIITYISVLERTKEIGILRAIGASKKDISRVFNAETIIEGFVAGAMGIVVTLILNIPINIIIKNVVNISNISVLPVKGAIILVIISMVLTVIAGLFPAKMASKKDPVEALRTE
ncbi:MAG: ATP-binding cassette domain-containing protein [Firmicutes bacterium]|nr:ATP-binding cassette domain-containing protein [Bacillota bacterium]